MSKNRILILVIVLAVVVLTAVGSWMAGSNIQSPAEVAARTAPPTPSAILVPVERRVLSSDVVTRGTARFGLPQILSIAPSVLKPDLGVVTRLPVRGEALREGDVLLTASGRPIFVLAGRIPVYRDLAPGTVGDDVRQLEIALRRLGFDPGPNDGRYDAQTSEAVAKFYGSGGWQPFGATDAQEEKIRTLKDELATARNAELAAADAAAAAPKAVEAARASARSSHRAALAELAAKSAQMDRIKVDREAPKEEKRLAKLEFRLARAAATSTRLAGEVEIQAAVDTRKVLEREAKLASEIVARLATHLELIRRKTGVQVPADEIVFLPSLPVRVEEVAATVGDPASGPLITVTNNKLSIDSSLRLDEAPLVKPGMPVAIDEPTLGIKASGVVSKVAVSPGSNGVDGYHVYFETSVLKASSSLEGVSLRLTIPIQSTQGEVTAVPVSALSLAADGTSRIQVEREGVLEFVVVEPGLSADGFVEVKPVAGTLTPGQLVVVGYENYHD